jgi:hypothetical protein
LSIRHISNHPRKYFPINEIKIIVATILPILKALAIR